MGQREQTLQLCIRVCIRGMPVCLNIHPRGSKKLNSFFKQASLELVAPR